MDYTMARSELEEMRALARSLMQGAEKLRRFSGCRPTEQTVELNRCFGAYCAQVMYVTRFVTRLRLVLLALANPEYIYGGLAKAHRAVDSLRSLCEDPDRVLDYFGSIHEFAGVVLERATALERELKEFSLVLFALYRQADKEAA